jgi:uncharacterized phage protein (TIGR01671 family)
MREIKFRAWSRLWTDTVGVLHVLTIDFVNRAVYVLPERELEGGNQEEWLFGEIDLMQWTGLKDNTGKEIYEGDIVDLRPEINDPVWHRKIVWDTGAFNCVQIRGKANHLLYFNKFAPDTEWVVIGNIYEHPHLLKAD